MKRSILQATVNIVSRLVNAASRLNICFNHNFVLIVAAALSYMHTPEYMLSTTFGSNWTGSWAVAAADLSSRCEIWNRYFAIEHHGAVVKKRHVCTTNSDETTWNTFVHNAKNESISSVSKRICSCSITSRSSHDIDCAKAISIRTDWSDVPHKTPLTATFLDSIRHHQCQITAF